MWDEMRNEKKYILLLFLFYLASQGLILVVSGLWFDDWCIMNISNQGLKMWALEMGKPDFFPIAYAMSLLPDVFYKIVIFGSYYLIAVIFFIISNKIFAINIQEAFLLTIIYLCMPVDDIRLERLNIMYTLGLTLFSVACYILVYKYESMTAGFHIVSVLLFFCSFILLNSLLCFMGIVWLFIVYKEKKIQNILMKFDYFIVPFIYFVFKNAFYSPCGIYTGYNSVTFDKIFKALTGTFDVVCGLASQILSVFLQPIINHPSILFLIFLFAIIINKVIEMPPFANEEKVYDKGISKEVIIELLVGFIVLYAGLYPYVVVGNRIVAFGFDSRNAILSPFGFSIILYVILRVVLNNKFRYAVIIFLMMISFAQFTKSYIGYQRIYYCDRGLQVHLMRNREIGDLKNVIIVEDDGGGSWYMYNGMFEEVYGNENRFVDNIVDYNRNILTGGYPTSLKKAWAEREWYNMTGADLDYNKIDGVIFYSNNISYRDALWIRLHEIIGENINEKLISFSSFRVIYPKDEEFSKYITQS